MAEFKPLTKMVQTQQVHLRRHKERVRGMLRSESYNVVPVNKLELKYICKTAKQFYLLKCTVLGNITPFRFVNGHHHSATTLQVRAVCSSEMFFRLYETTRRIHPNYLYIYIKLHGIISQKDRNP